MLSAREASKRRTTLKESIAAGHAIQQQQYTSNGDMTGSSSQGQLAGSPNGSQQQQESAGDGALGANGDQQQQGQGLQQQAWAAAEQLSAGAAAAAVSVRSNMTKAYTSFKGSPGDAAVS